MSDCEGCASKEAQIVFLANRAAAGQRLFEIVEGPALGPVIRSAVREFRKRAHSREMPTGLRVELDGKVLIEPKETPGAHDRRDDWERGPSKMLKVTRLMDSKGNE